jgi:hypothetical protein
LCGIGFCGSYINITISYVISSEEPFVLVMLSFLISIIRKLVKN